MPARLPSRGVALVAALLTAVGLLGAAAPASAAGHHRATAAVHQRTTVLLPTGDAVSFDPSRPRDLRVRTRTSSGIGHDWRAFERRGHTYVVPATALPFLGTVLDPSLFDVTAAAARGSRPHVTVGVSKGMKASVPGLTVQKRSRATQSGYFTAAGARRFGAALQRAAGRTHGRSSATRSLFGASSIGTGASIRALAPQFRQQTVIFKVTGADGKPLPEGVLFYGDLDQAARATDFAFVLDGEVRVSLPAGNYTLYGEALTFTSDTTAVDRIVTDPALRVTGRRNQTVAVDFRTATAQPLLHAPQPTTTEDLAVIYDREWKDAAFTAFATGDSSLTLLLAPAAAPAIGTVTTTTYFRDEPTSGAAEEYDAVFTASGAIAADQSHTLAADRFADVQERLFDTGAPGDAAFGHGVVLPDGSGLGVFDGVRLPLTRTDHLYAPDGAFWSDELVSAPTDLDPFGGEVVDGLRSYRPGSATTAEWLRQAVAPAVPTFTADDLASGVSCPACRTAKQLTVSVVPLQDTAASGHDGFVVDPDSGLLAARTRLYRDGDLIDDEPGSNAVEADVPSGAADYRVTAESTPSVAGFALGTAARTDWTFRSSSSTGAALPADFACSAGGSGTCRVLPMLRVVAPLPVQPDGTMALGSSTFPLCITPVQGAVTDAVSAAAQVSFDGGRTFQDVPLAASGVGCWTATLTNPPDSAGAGALVRISGSTASGSTVLQTVRNAYRVANR